MKSVSIDSAVVLISINAVTRVVIECFDGRRWCSVLRGREKFVLKSACQNPKAFAKVETALTEIQELGLRHAEIDLRGGSASMPRLPRLPSATMPAAQ